MKIPKSIKIAGHIVEVFDNYHFKERGDVDGDSNLTNNYIMIGYTIESESTKAQIFLHEILHHIGLRYLGDANFLKEEATNSLSEGLLQVLRDNKLDFGDKK